MSTQSLKNLWRIQRTLKSVTEALAKGDPLYFVHKSECDTEQELRELAQVRVRWAKLERAYLKQELRSELAALKTRK